MRRVIAAPRILYGEEMKILKDGYILIEDGEILEVEKGENLSKAEESFVAKGCVVIPGLINAHTHLGDAVFKDAGSSKSLEELFRPPHGLKYELLKETPRGQIVETLRETLRDITRLGVTTVADFREGAADGAKMMLEALTEESPRTLILGQPDHPFTEEELESNTGTFSEEELRRVEDMMNLVYGLAPSSPNDLTDEALRQLARIAEGRGKFRAIHAVENPRSQEISRRRTGSTEVERALKHFEADMLIHLTYATKDEMDLIFNRSVICCPRANATLGLGLPPIPELLRKGINVALGTDNAMMNTVDMFREMEFTAKAYRISAGLNRLLDSKDIFKMATINGAKALKIERFTGSINVGKSADLAAIDFDAPNLRYNMDLVTALTHRVRSDNVSMVMVAGKTVYDREKN